MTDPGIREYVGVYDADGGVRGEVAYVVGHLLRMRECALCDITHTWRRKPEWDAMAARLGVPFTLVHRNEIDDDAVADGVAGSGLPVVLGRTDDGWAVVLDRAQLESAAGRVDVFEGILTDAARRV
ncbi:hypothetical protein GCM10022200_19470 [Microbacterium awajiense]|uniref:Uncharacterized protein n=1 Tax=Microbacterium awajiense TaxID=415214 RepID=A0ABP7ANN0_9MICO